MLSLTISERRDLRARAHSLNPTVMIGNAGLSESVIREIGSCLRNHELIKIRVLNDDRAERAAMLESICEQLNAAPVQHIGKVLVVYQPNPDEKLIEIKQMPRHRGKKPLTKKQLASRAS
ncbi:MAG: ribosome assembly RNA-binding protein YhbY [Gallionella sp.]|jgi:putative YhbY family RNA-binding protein|nr:ribosome assembly RNA-binding protein YhbY [Gallionella sp.]